MKNALAIMMAVFALCIVSNGQLAAVSKSVSDNSKVAAASTAGEIAKAALAAHGGEKLKKLRSFLVKGSVDLSFQGQSLPGAFSTAFSGDKYYFEIITAVQQLKQVFDGRNTVSSIQGFELPPVTSLGFPLLPKIGDPAFVIAALPENLKKRRGFRMTTPEGFYTDFFVDEKMGQIKAYEAKWMNGNQTITTSVEIDAFMTVDGIAVPQKYSQRFDLGAITAYVNFKAKDVKINSPIEDSAFSMTK